ncbi:sugar transporter permease [Geodermatophilus sp. TF02-6]|uniref:ABC transporter permease subunit n=1 Tax=Geodermatophilus sp. TF02-6 TaxID=2250575 RepID=UPI000DE8573F|nr:ABC transporter permease subunit [Geodermatophilus sp. TF02-6]RBY83642.1 sugar transporter permease [Geodermatophilus sp. TF02-6]
MARSTVDVDTARPTGSPPGGRGRAGLGVGSDGTSSPLGLVLKIAALALLAAVAVWGAVPLVRTQNWIGLAVLVAVTLLGFYVYLSPRTIPLKYLLPGTLFLIAFQILPIVYTVATAFTNFSDGHRGSKEEAIAAIEGASVQQVPGSPVYDLTIAADGDPSTGDLVFLLADPTTDQVFAGTSDGLAPLSAADVQRSDAGRITAAEGYTVLDVAQISDRQDDLTAFTVPTDDGAIRNQGLSSAFDGAPQRAYDAGCDCITDAASGRTWTADDGNGAFVADDGQTLAQGWRVGVGLRNFGAIFTNDVIRSSFLRIVVWNFAFAFLTVLITFGLGLLVALALNNPMLKGKTFYRSLIILPYAMPAVAMYLVWRNMFNTDFGLINRILGTHVNWLGNTASSMVAILLVQLWLGYNYMFLVITGALQSIPKDLTEAAGVDGAKPFYAFRTITFPLLLVALAPLLISSFAFNFNNFNAIYLVTQGGPFSPDNPSAGGTDLLITYTYRLAFGGAGADYGFAAAISVVIFLIVGVISVLAFRRTRALEEVN